MNDGGASDRPAPEDVVARHQERIMALPDVHGLAVAARPGAPSELCIMVYTTRGRRPAGLPDELEGYPVETFASGGFRAT